MQKIKNISINIVIFIATFLVFFLMAEIIVRAMYKEDTVLFPRYHTDVQYNDFTLRALRPNSEFWHTSQDGSWKFTINSKGLRADREFSYSKSDGKLRILALGDSHTQGFEVRQDYTFSAIIEKYLQHRGIQAEAINAGISGFSTAEELLYLENEGIKYNPDVVVLGFYANDYEDNIKAGFFKLDDDGNLNIVKNKHIPGVWIQNIIYELPFVTYLSENSYFYSILFNATWNTFKAQLAKNAEDKVSEYAIATQDNASDYQTALTAALIQRMYRFCSDNNIKLIVLDIPRVKTDGDESFESSVNATLLPFVKNNSDAYLSSTELFSDYSGAAELHVAHGHRHISEFTHTIFGVATAKKIESLLVSKNKKVIVE